MAIAATTVWECNSSGGSIQNGSGFNPGNANFMADLTTDTNTGNTASPVVSSASYNFVAGDVNAYVYIKSGTSWTPGWYQIASVAANKATLSAAIGQAIQTDATKGYPTPVYNVNTVVGVATVGTPTSGTFGIDYSQATASTINGTDLALVTNTTATSAGTPFGLNHIGNHIRISAGTGFTTGWYEITSVTGVTATIDRSAGTAPLTAGTFRVGGAYPMNGANEDAFFESAIAGNRYFLKGAFTLAAGFNITTGIGGVQKPVVVEGYNTRRGDAPTGSSRPSINGSTFSNPYGVNWDVYNVIHTGTGVSSFQISYGNKAVNCKFSNTSTTAGRNASVIAGDALLYKCEFVSYRGNAAVNSTGGNTYIGCYFHDSNAGISLSSGSANSILVSDSIFESMVTAAYTETVANNMPATLLNNTFLGSITTPYGVGVNQITATNSVRLINNIFVGFTTAIVHADTQTEGFADYNDFFNNTNNVSSSAQWQLSTTELTVNPVFASVSEIRFTNGTTSGSVVTSSGADFSSVTDNIDFLYLISGTGITAAKYLITAHTTTTLTLSSAPGTSAVADKVGQITTGHNFAVNPVLKGTGYPGVFPAGFTTGYQDQGAAQRFEPLIRLVGPGGLA